MTEENTLEVNIRQLKVNALALDIVDTIKQLEFLNKRLETKIKILKKIRKDYEKSINNMDCQKYLQTNMEPIYKPNKNERNTNKKLKTKKSTSTNGN